MKKIQKKLPKQSSRGANYSGGIVKTSSVAVPAEQPIAPTPDNMIMIALQNNRSMDEIQKLIDMRNAEIARLAELAFYDALKEFQRNCPQIRKNKTVDFEHKDNQGRTNYKYTELDHLINTVREAEANAGLSHSWETTYNEKGEVIITCVLAHSGGHKVKDSMKGLPDTSGKKNSIQQVKSTISYLRRATFESVLGVSQGGQDDDGQGADPARIGKGIRPDPVAWKGLMDQVAKKLLTVEQVTGTYNLTEEEIDTLNICARDEK